MFEKASRLKLRFDTGKGQLAVEDLWDLPLSGNGANLDKIAIALSRQLREENVESFVRKAPKDTSALQLQFDIAKHIINTRLAEQELAANRAAAKAKKDKILEIIARKQDAALEGSSLEELQQLASTL